MLVSKIEKGNHLEIIVDGAIDTLSAPKLEKFLSMAIVSGSKNIVINMAKVPYISSAGLRTFLTVLRLLEHIRNSSLVLENANSRVVKIFDITGFTPLFVFK